MQTGAEDPEKPPQEDAEDPDKPPQGWFLDPFGVHEQRWFSQGTPTALVRDGRTEVQDPPPDEPVPGPPMRVTAPPRQGPASDDILRADARDRDIGPDTQFDFMGNPATPGMVGTPTTAAQAVVPGIPMITVRTDGVPLTPKRIIRTRWVALGFSVAWTLLLTGLLLTATTTTHSGTGHAHSQSLVGTDPGGVIAFIGMLAVAVGITGAGFVRRLRAHSEAAGRAGYVFTGIIGILGVLSLASIGLALVILAVALFVVARPLKRPRPLPGEQVT